MSVKELSIIQKTYDAIRWYVPILSRLPRSHQFTLGHRMTNGWYDLLDGLLVAQYRQDKLPHLIELNGQLDILRYQTRLLHDFELINMQRYEYAAKLLNSIGLELGGWIKQQRQKASP